jgi:hypothetical protein
MRAWLSVGLGANGSMSGLRLRGTGMSGSVPRRLSRSIASSRVKPPSA